MANKQCKKQESYEEVRRRKLAENKRKLEELNLSHLSLTLGNACSPKPSPAKQVKRKAAQDEIVVVSCRRSNRIANLPLPDLPYKEVIPEVVVVKRRRIGGVSKHRDLSGRVFASPAAREYATERAEQIELELGGEFPSFVRPMLPSHTTGGFWLGLPRHFCTKHLPKRDSTVTLIDEDGEETDTVYLAYKNGLSGGWRGFSLDHDLVDGDALVFQLINPTSFKIYIVRESEYDRK